MNLIFSHGKLVEQTRAEVKAVCLDPDPFKEFSPSPEEQKAIWARRKQVALERETCAATPSVEVGS